jgi:23S rRNA pseudouridine2457 synthase
VRILQEPLPIPHRVPHLIKHQNKPYTWLSITLTEGKNRQIRRMTAAMGYPTVRLVRVRINQLLLNTMQPGEVVAIDKPW